MNGHSEHRREGCGGLILCGGRSSRMGYPKAGLRFPGGPLLGRVLERMREVADPVVLSLAAGENAQALPLDVTSLPSGMTALPSGVTVVTDSVGEQGPLWGLLEGFRALRERCNTVVVIPVDMPFMMPAHLARLVDGLAGKRICMYEHEGFANALTAAYDLEILPKLEGLVAEGRRRPIFLREGESTEILTIEADGKGPHPMTDVDTPEAYRAALLAEGVGSPGASEVSVEVSVEASTEMSREFKEQGIEARDLEAHPLRGYAALHADKAGELLVYLLRLYPELGSREFGRGIHLNLERSLAGQPAELLASHAPLLRGEHLRLVTAGPERAGA